MVHFLVTFDHTNSLPKTKNPNFNLRICKTQRRGYQTPSLTLSPEGGRIPATAGGLKAPPPGYQGRRHFTPYIVKSYFETFKINYHMQKFRAKSQKLGEI